MTHWYKHIRFIAIIVTMALAFPQSIQGQPITGAFIMSSVGTLQNMSNNSMAVNFTSSAICLNIQNGTAVLTGNRGTGSFAINCDVNTKYNSLGIRLYPNPVTPNTKVKFINTPPLTELFSITVWSSEGYKVSTTKATGYEIFQGKQMNFSTIGTGSYIIQIESEKYRDALKFIKAN